MCCGHTVRQNLAFGVEICESGFHLSVGKCLVVFPEEAGVDSAYGGAIVEYIGVIGDGEGVSLFTETFATEFCLRVFRLRGILLTDVSLGIESADDATLKLDLKFARSSRVPGLVVCAADVSGVPRSSASDGFGEVGFVFWTVGLNVPAVVFLEEVFQQLRFDKGI